MKNLKIYFVSSGREDEFILGKKAKDYLFCQFQGYDFEVVNSVDDIESDVFPRAVLPLDMPLVTEKYLVRTLKFACDKGANRVVFGDCHSPFGVFVCEGDKTYFLSDDVFLQLGGAKNNYIVYNTIRKRILDRLLDKGVTLLGDDFHIDDTVAVESGATLKSPVTLSGHTVVKGGAFIENSIVLDSTVESGVVVTSSHISASQVGENSSVGPFARLRGAEVGGNCRIGDFVEVKNSSLKSGVKCAHLAYIGDADVGESTNIGCGTVFCNYDGEKKHRTAVGKKCFIGANVNLVAPVVVDDGVYVAAGTTVTKDIAKNGFAIGRVRQENKNKKPNKQCSH